MTRPNYFTKSALEAAADEACQRHISDVAERLTRQRSEWLDRAALAALASGIPQSELWLENLQVGETRLMRHVDGPPAVGEYSRGEVIARVWMGVVR